MSIGEAHPSIFPQGFNREIKLETFRTKIKKHRASTTINSPRPLPQIENKVKQLGTESTKLPYSGLSIGLMKLHQRSKKGNKPIHPPLNYSHFFSDMYFNSETISFPKVDKPDIIEENDSKGFFLPARVNFRRLKRRIWSDIKNKEEELSGINNFTTRSAGKGYDLNHKNKELLPMTRFKAREGQVVSNGLKIKGILKAFKN